MEGGPGVDEVVVVVRVLAAAAAAAAAVVGYPRERQIGESRLHPSPSRLALHVVLVARLVAAVAGQVGY